MCRLWQGHIPVFRTTAILSRDSLAQSMSNVFIASDNSVSGSRSMNSTLHRQSRILGKVDGRILFDRRV